MVGFVSERDGTAFMLAKDSDVPVERLPRRLRTLKEFLVDEVARDCRNFAATIADWRDNELWKDFAESWEEFVLTELEKPVEWVDLICHGFSLLQGGTQPITVKEAIAAAKASPLSLPGRPTMAEPEKQRPQKQGTSTEYLLARIARDYPEILDQIGAGKTYASPRAAAVALGIIKAKKSVQVDPENPELTAKQLRRLFSPEQLLALKALL